MLDFNVISSQKHFVKILCLGLKDASKCQHYHASCPLFGASLQLRSNVGPLLHHAMLEGLNELIKFS